MIQKNSVFKGKSLAELKQMSLKEFALLCNARARRTLQRQKIDEKLMKKIESRLNEKDEKKRAKVIRTHKRDTIIIPKMVGLTFGIYNGKEFMPVTIQGEMLGKYLGEFALTRKKVRHGKAGIGATRSSTAIATKK